MRLGLVIRLEFNCGIRVINGGRSILREIANRARLCFRLVIWGSVSSIAVAMRPSLYLIAVTQLRAFARKDWFLRFPFLPMPDIEYLRFRMETLYGTKDALPPTVDLIEYLRWCRMQRRLWV